MLKGPPMAVCVEVHNVFLEQQLLCHLLLVIQLCNHSWMALYTKRRHGGQGPGEDHKTDIA